MSRPIVLTAALFGLLPVTVDCSQTPGAIPPAGSAQSREAMDILHKTLATYATAKSYQGTWSYTLERGNTIQKMVMEIRAKPPARLDVRVGVAPGSKRAPDGEKLPEMQVVVDGTAAWFQNTSENTYFRVPLPAGAQVSPLLFIPQMPAAQAVKRLADQQADGHTYFILTAPTPMGGQSRVEIDSQTYRIARIIGEETVGLTAVVSTLKAEKEAFGADLPDASFAYNRPPSAREIAAPPGSAAIFGGTG